MIHHVALSVQNLEASLVFYKGFGFELETQRHLWDREVTLTVVAGRHGRLELFSSVSTTPAPKEMSDLRSDLRQIGVKHFALQVEDIKAELAWLRAADADISGDVASTDLGFDHVFLRDPSGNWIELIQPHHVSESV